jgi:AraC-like DNA-binding protein
MDALADVLKTIRLHTSTYFCSDFNTAWGMDIAPADKGLFHVLIEGQGWLKAANQTEPLHLEQGDIVAFPTGGAHWIGDSVDSTKIPGNEVVKSIINGKNPFYHEAHEPNHAHHADSRHTLLCGAFEYDSSAKHPFLKDLPCFIHIKASTTPELNWLRSLMQVLAIESKQASPGSSVVIDRLTEVLFIQLLRVYMEGHQRDGGYLAALNDDKIGKALNLIHNEQTILWSVSTLASETALSRSAFSERFVRLVGESPKSYLINWRMQKAKTLLLENVRSMHDIAERSGYSSEAAFSKAFKQLFDITPGSLRKNR